MDPLSPLPSITPPPAFLKFGEQALYGEVVPQKHSVHQAALTTYMESKHQLNLIFMRPLIGSDDDSEVHECSLLLMDSFYLCAYKLRLVHATLAKL